LRDRGLVPVRPLHRRRDRIALREIVGMRDQFDTFEFEPTPEGGTQVVQRVRLKNGGRLSLFTYHIECQYITAYWRRGHRTLLSVITDDNAVA
jgi:hypothetical protein